MTARADESVRTPILIFLAQLLGAQGGDPWSALRANNPPGFTLTLRLLLPHAFREGELIQAEMNLPRTPVPGPAQAEMWQFNGFLLDPAADCGTLAKPCFLLETGGIIGSEAPSFALNSYLPPLAPSHYRVAALARKLILGQGAPRHTSYIYADPPQYAVSGTVDIHVVAAPRDWIRDTVTRSVAILNGPPRDRAGYEAQREAAQQLSFLNHPAAWAASLEILPKEEAIVLAGLSRARPQAAICELMQQRVAAPTQSVSTGYLYRMSEICVRAHLPTPPLARPAPPDPAMQAWFEKQRSYTEGVMSKAATALAGSLASKQTTARAEAFATLLQRIQQVRNNRPPAPDPDWIPLLTAAFVRDFASVDIPRQQYLLDMYSSTIDSPDVAPLLETVLDRWKPGDYYEAAHSALRALNRIDPARARERVLAEVVKEKTWLDVPSLEMLPAASVPPMDDTLIEALARDQRPGGWSAQLRMAAIARYATKRALPRIRAIYESQKDPCQPELAAYFVRVDPAYADRIFHRQPWDMHAALPRCTIQYFNRTPPLAMGPPLERYLTTYLMHGDVFVKTTAARVLARYGSPAALPPLWEAFRYFHEYWKGKNAELERLGEGVQLEVELRNAIARGRGWLATETDLRLIESLCISGRCIQETQSDLREVKPPLRIEITGQQFGFGRVGQYYMVESADAMTAKLAQFPRGTRFVLYAPGGPAAQAAAGIRRFATDRGLIVTSP